MQYDKNQMFNVRVDGYKGFMGPPFFVESLDPRTVIPIMTPMGPTAHVKRYKVQRYEVEEALAEAGQPIHIKTGDTGQIEDIIKLKPGQELPEEAPSTNDHQVTYYELIDDEWCYYVCEDRVIHAYRHKGGIRIVHGYGLITGFKEFEMMAVGILYPVRHEIPQFDFLRTLWANRAYIDVFPQLFAELEAGMEPLRDSDKNPEQWEIEPMTIKQIRGKITNAFKDAQAGVDYRALVEEMAVDIDMATIPGIARGVGGAQQPGYAINQLSQSMRTVWKPLIDSRTLQWSTLAHHYLWSLKHLVKEETTVFTEKTDAKGFKTGEYLSLEPEDLQDFFQIVADLQPDLPIDAQGNMMTWMKAGGDGWATWEEVSREGFNRPDWKTRRDQTERDSARKAMFPDAMQDAIMIGKIRLQQQIAEESGMTDLNAPFQQSLESMRATAGQTPGPGTGAGQGGPEGTNGAPAGANGAVKGAQNGIAPTTGANPATAAPGPRR
jgi:hypothetical protein